MKNDPEPIPPESRNREHEVPSGPDAEPFQPAFGEVVSRRPWYLVLLVFPFGLLLAVAPFLFPLERSVLPEVLQAYDAVCRRADPGIRCVDRRDHLPRVETLEGSKEGRRVYRLILVPRSESNGVSEGRWIVIDDGEQWVVHEERPSP